MKKIRKRIGAGGGGACRVGGGGGGRGQGGCEFKVKKFRCEQRIEVFVKIKKKRFFWWGGGGGGVWLGGGVSGWM